MILSKLDEAVQLAGPIAALVSHSLPVNYITNGQHVPDDIRVASAAEIADSLLSAHLTSGSLPRYLHAQRAA